MSSSSPSPTAAAAAAAAGPDYETLANRFRPIFAKIAEGASRREQDHQLPFAEIRELASAGFGAVRVPVAHGGAGASLPQLFRLLTELAAADTNIPQALRGHFAFVEDRLVSSGAQREVWLERFARGEIAGNSWTEVGTVKIGDVITKVSPDPASGEGNFLVNGTKYYSTGSIFADWIDTFAQRTDDGTKVIAVVNAHQPGVVHSDDWDGFGQRTTGSGTSTFTDAVVESENVIDFGTRFKYQTAFYQAVLLAVLAGSIHGAERDIADEVRRRTRIFSHGNADSFAADPQILQVVGQVSARAYAAEAVVERAAQALQGAYEAAFGDDLVEEEHRNDLAELETAQAQVILTELATRATSDIFDALGASGTSTGKNLDRHWRNARTAASHNPWVFKARIVGDWVVNGATPPRVWSIGAGPKADLAAK
ncbi:monooxygenase [Sinomonas cellulolyticus]|uniref:Acyl-CoA dehydrogenase family protein n=1 Tax=Sinomonas cellulolyticus TaxID=2801916 RepID=A0ABS1K013_9MICC|nr:MULTISPECIES: acyl-CoA dehydrogenase family protein [Sinomonas]MBL0704991.1 acyl-CoA dehydrogenase family protein [Sinomonas cellulolyticus]GHG53646.1 monooxygenase [Sinomonas sp. KCTC 49339]